MSFARIPALAALVVAAGCADARSTDPSSTEVPFQSGSLRGTTIGRLGMPQTTSGPGATLTGLVGTFTRLTSGGVRHRNAVSVYFTSDESPALPFRMWQVGIDGSGLEQLVDDTVRGISPSIAPSGGRLLFWKAERPLVDLGAPNPVHLMERLADGSIRRLLDDEDAITPVSWTPDESAVIYGGQHLAPPFAAFIRRARLDSLIPADVVERRPTHAIPQLTVGSSNGHTVVIYQNPAFGLNLLDLTTGVDSTWFTPADSDLASSPDLSRDGRKVAFVFQRHTSGLSYHSDIRIADITNPAAADSLPVPSQTQLRFDIEVRWLPDGSGLVVRAQGPPRGWQLHLLDTTGHLIRQLTSLSPGVAPGISVGPATAPLLRVLIGEDGPLGRSTSGIIFGQDSSGGLTSIVGFHSDRPRSVKLTANTGLNATGPALTYSLTADQLRTLRFINGPPGGTPVTVLDSASAPAAGALLNFDGANGTVTLVLPFAAGGNLQSTVTESGGSRAFRGNFLGVWSGGTNLAPRGATEVRLDSRSGQVEVTP